MCLWWPYYPDINSEVYSEIAWLRYLIHWSWVDLRLFLRLHLNILYSVADIKNSKYV